MMRRFLAGLLMIGASAHGADMVATSLPAMSEPSWAITDGGNTYLVGKQSGTVLIIRSGDIAPRPQPRPIPIPIPDPITGVKWLSVIVDPDNPDQAAWRTDSALRTEVERKAINYRSYLATESDVDSLGFRASLQSTGTPCVILQDASGKLVKVIRPANLADIMAILEAIK
jgi:hypothetical protein